VHDVDARCQYVRTLFTELPDGSAAGMREFMACEEPAESKYYDPIYAHRLRWNDVFYEPGELKAVAYNKGSAIGSAIVRTAGNPVAIRLTPDRKKLEASGEDLCYVLVEAIDEKGTVCPLADNMIHFEVKGPGEILGVGNGDPLSVESFQAEHCRLFFGKAMLIVGTIPGEPGEVQIVAKSDGLTDSRTHYEVLPSPVGETLPAITR
jgi:beta-galactosidase